MVLKLRQRLEKSTCHDTKRIAEEFGISITTLRKYQKMTDEKVTEIEQIKKYKKRKTKMDNYSNIIYEKQISFYLFLAYLF